MQNIPTPAIVLIISGPAGSGKTTLCDQLLEDYPGSIRRLVTTTSRKPRTGEIDGVDYHFLDESVFKKRIQEGRFIEWAMVHGRYYGSQSADVLDSLADGLDLLLNIDIQGAEAFRRKQEDIPGIAGKVHTVFIKPASVDQLKERLKARGTDDPPEIERRLKSAEKEVLAAGEFDHTIVSGTREADYAALRKLYEKLRQPAPSS